MQVDLGARSKEEPRAVHDIMHPDEAGIAAQPLSDRKLDLSVARDEAMFFRQNDAGGRGIHYEAVVSGTLRLVPSGAAPEAFAKTTLR